MNQSTKNIPATLDLNKSLLDFEVAIAPTLALDKVEKWDGRTLKHREALIRSTALQLAGQCVALFLHKLSQSQLAQETAINQTQGWWRLRTRRHGSCQRQVLTIGNVVVNLKLSYVVERRNKPKGKKKIPTQGFCPWLAMVRDVRRYYATGLVNDCGIRDNKQFFCCSTFSLKAVGNTNKLKTD